MRVFLDANILFSAAKSDGGVRALLRLLVEHEHTCCADGYVMTEARRNLAAKGADALVVLDALLPHLHLVEGVPESASALSSDAEWLPEKDRPVLIAAIRLRCDVLVTGDRSHFGAGYGRVFDGVTILSPRMLAERLIA
jgi:uncharacterized protein